MKPYRISFSRTPPAARLKSAQDRPDGTAEHRRIGEEPPEREEKDVESDRKADEESSSDPIDVQVTVTSSSTNRQDDGALEAFASA